MRFHAHAPRRLSKILNIQSYRVYLPVFSSRFHPSKIYIMSQSRLSYLSVDTLSPSAPMVANAGISTLFIIHALPVYRLLCFLDSSQAPTPPRSVLSSYLALIRPPLPQNYLCYSPSMPAAFFWFRNRSTGASTAELQFHCQILATGLTEWSVAVDSSLYSGFKCGNLLNHTSTLPFWT